MDDKTVVALVKTNAVNLELDTLREIVSYLQDMIALRTVGKPEGLKIGSNIHALDVRYEWHQYGEVVRFAGKACFIKSPGASYETKIAYAKNVIRIVDEREWHWIEKDLLERRAAINKQISDEEADRVADLEDAVASRTGAKEKRRSVLLKSGETVTLYRGAYVHAYRADRDEHSYGVVVDFTPKSCYIAHRNWTYGNRLVYSKINSIEELSDSEWAEIEPTVPDE